MRMRVRDETGTNTGEEDEEKNNPSANTAIRRAL